MTINIEGLKQYQAVQFGDKYIVCLSTWSDKSTHCVNGVDTPASQVVVDDLTSIFKLVKPSPELTHYVDESGDVVSVEKYTEMMTAFTGEHNKYYDEDVDDYIYPDLDTEYMVKKLKEPLSKLKHVFKEFPVEQRQVEIDVVGVLEDTGSQFIETSVQFGKTSWQGGAGAYKVGASNGIVIDEIRKIKDESDDLDIPTHSGLRYVKLNGKYIFSSESLTHMPHKYFTSLEDAKEFEQSLRKQARNLANPYLNRNQEVSVTERAEIAQVVKQLKDFIFKAELRKNSPTSKHNLLARSNKLLELLGKEEDV